MKNIVVILSLLGLFSCKDTPTTNNCAIEFCSNALKLISKFDTIPTIDYGLLDLNDSIHQKVESSLQPSVENTNLFFNVLYDCDSIDTLKLSFTYYFGEDNPTRLVTIPRFPLSLNTMGDVLYGPEITMLDSLKNKIYNYYLNIGESNYPETYTDICYTLLWDEDVNKQLFRKFVNQIIGGYLIFINYQCKSLFNKDLCQLDNPELASIAGKFPFILYLADYETIDINSEIDIEDEFDFDMQND